jgi:hypothetical protein
MTLLSYRVAVLLVTLSVGAAPTLHAARRAETAPRVRGVNVEVQRLVEFGLDTSASLRALVARLAGGDVVVYVRYARLPTRIDGQLTFLSVAGGIRYVIVDLAWGRSTARRLATLGHELQHAVEILADPTIVNADSLARAYSRMGFVTEWFASGAAFDTWAAVNAGDQVWKEVSQAAAAD